MPTYGQRPEDVISDSRGNALKNVEVRLYHSEANATTGDEVVGSVFSDERGRWSFTAAAGELWARLPDGTVWQVSDSGNLEDYLNITSGDERYYTKAQVDATVAAEVASRIGADAGKSDVGHNHNELYYTEAEVDTALAAETSARTAADAALDARLDAVEGGGVAIDADSLSDATVTGKALIRAADAAAARTTIGATTVGSNVLTAADAAAARTAIGAGTSSLALGTTSSTAKAGDYQPASTNISDSTSVGRSVLTAANAAAARTAIGAGTGNVTGTGITDIWTGSQASYDAIGTKSSTTLYVIV